MGAETGQQVEEPLREKAGAQDRAARRRKGRVVVVVVVVAGAVTLASVRFLLPDPRLSLYYLQSLSWPMVVVLAICVFREPTGTGS